MDMSIILAARLVLAVIFLTSGIGKLRASSALVDDILEYRLLSSAQSKLFAAILPYLEIALATCCLVGFEIRATALLSACLLTTFTIGIVINLMRGRTFNCHCFGSSNSVIGIPVVMRNITLISLACFVFAASSGGIDQWKREFVVVTDIYQLAPILGSSALMLGILFLFGEVKTKVFSSQV